MASNELYLAVLPIIHISTGLTEETLTVFPDKNFATEFFENEVDGYENMFLSRANKYLVGGHVKGYILSRESAGAGRVIVKVTQNVA